MKRYHVLLVLLTAGMFFTVSLPANASVNSTLVELAMGQTPSQHDCLVLKAAAEASHQSYDDLYNGFVSGTVTITELPDNLYRVVYGPGENDFIIIDLEED